GNFNINCHGIAEGSIDLSFSGGSGAYYFDWTGPEGSAIIQGQEDQAELIAGSYSVIVTDANGCNMQFDYDLTEPDTIDIAFSPDLTFDGLYNIDCYGGTADVDITASGGSTTGYRYTWYSANGTGLIITDEDQTGLSSGMFVVTVDDLNGCIYIDSIGITEPDSLVLIFVTYDITCEVPGMDNGSVDLEVSGGGEPYSYNWSNGDTSQDINNLVEGRYTVVVTDTYGCIVSDSGDIFLPPPLEFTKDISDYNGVGISCNGLNNGWISVDMISGEEPYSYIWTGPGDYSSSDNSIDNLLAGRYIIEITDQNLCRVIDTTNLSEPGRIGIDLLLSQSNYGGYNVNCFGDNTGTIDVIPVNPVGEVRYFWTDGNLQSSEIMD
ncbi:MAG: SprB repeat-containing protein, partial [Bacteroidales bacterium]|nr:SprB repeat-containing protein [Bacteroidales bacterium]